MQLIPDQPDAPQIVTDLPGPRAAAIIERDHAVLSPSYTRDYPFVIDRGLGVVVDDPDGNRFLDLNAGIGGSDGRSTDIYTCQAPTSITRRRPPWASGSRQQLRCQAPAVSPSATRAPRRSRRRSSCRGTTPAGRTSSRSTARSMGALSLTASKAVQRRGFLPLVPEVTHVQFPFCYRCDRRDQVLADADCCGRSLEEIEEVLLRRMVSPTDVAAIFVEAVQGEGGYVVPPPSFLRGLRRICDTHGILLVCDEVQSGMGRTGKMFAVEHAGVEPDMITVAKGIASGLPLGALVARAEQMHWAPGAHASTFGGNPVSCAAALATVDLLEGGLVTHAAELGAHLRQRLLEVMTRQSAIGDVRGLGLMVAVDLVTDRDTREPASALRTLVLDQAFRRGALLLGCGESAIRFSPPLVISRAQIHRAVEIFETALEATIGT